jgi:hypothetical protein
VMKLTPEEWKSKLSEEEHWVMRESGTERPHISAFNAEWREGTYHCKGCGIPLFSSDARSKHHPSGGPLARHGPHRSPMLRMRQPLGACVSGRADRNRHTVLHQRSLYDVPTRPRLKALQWRRERFGACLRPC